MRVLPGLLPAHDLLSSRAVSLIFAIALLALAAVIGVSASLWLVVQAFRRHVGWGLAVLFVPLANLVFSIVHWAEAKRPFFLGLLAVALAAGGAFLLPRERLVAEFLQRVAAARAASTSEARTPPPAVAAEPAPLTEPERRLAALKTQEAELLRKKNAIDPKDKAGALALAQEIANYNVALQAALAAKADALNAPASGQIAGQPFTVEQATLKDGVLTLRQGKEFFADREVAIFLFLKDTEIPAGRKWSVPGAQGATAPHVHLSWRDQARGLPKTRIFMGDYRMQLEFEQAGMSQLRGRIVLSTEDDSKSKVTGTFMARIAAVR